MNSNIYKSKLSKSELIVFIAIVSVILFLWFRFKNKEREFILNDYSFAKCKLIRLYTDDGGSLSYVYEYKIGDKKYKYHINPNKSKYDYCDDNFKSCDTLLFWIIYSNTIPSKHLIDLTQAIQENEDPGNRTLNNFEN